MFMEKLSMYTPHFHQSRLMNVYGAAKETLTYISEHQINEKSGAYIQSGIEEIESCLSMDSVAISLFGQIESHRKILFKSITGGNYDPANLRRLSSLCKAILVTSRDYEEKLLQNLHGALFSPTDLSKVGRITDSISSLTGLYVTHLLQKGFSPTYLYNRVDMFRHINNYGGRTFQKQFELVTERLKNYTTAFDVFFGIHSSKLGIFPTTSTASAEFLQTPPDELSEKELDRLKKEFEPNIYVKISINSTDYVTASWNGKELLDKVLDITTALELNPRIQVSSQCISISKNAALIHKKHLNVGLLVAFLSSENGTHLSNTDTKLHATSTKLNEISKAHLGRSLRYLRLARESISLEQKILNLWIALESLFSEGDSSIIANITSFVPQFYAVTGIARRVIYIRNLLVKNDVEISPLAKQVISTTALKFNEETTPNEIFSILRDENAATELFGTLGELEHLKFRFKKVSEEVKDQKTILARIGQSEKDVSRQLRRIYFVRNKITHTGHYENIRPQLITHLLDYLVVSYLAISDSATAAKAGHTYSIGELLDAYKMGAEQVIHSCKEGPHPSTFANLLPVAVI
jgi:hypothetical protein